jgi:signal transduction histidine kinase
MTAPNILDRDLTLRDLLEGLDRRALERALRTLGDGGACLADPDGAILAGDPATGAQATSAHPLRVRGILDPVGRCLAPAGSERLLQGIGGVLELLLTSQARYHLASAMHIEAIHADYDALKETARSLAESEARYKALASSLEARVREQTVVIEAAQRRLYQQDKLASVGQLAAGVAHEINNPIGFVKSNLSTARRYLDVLEQALTQQAADGDARDTLEDFRALLRESLDGIARVARIVADLKGFSHVDGSEETPADINEGVRSALNVAASAVTNRADVETAFAPLPLLRCRPGLLNQVFLNLIVNAAQAMDRRGIIRIGTALVGDAIHVTVSDTGSGIPPDVLPRIFDPFFTTKDVGQGTGLGLTVSHDIVTAHGGAIEVAGEAGVGTTFTVILPVKA